MVLRLRIVYQVDVLTKWGKFQLALIAGPLEQEVVGFEDHLRYLRRERKIRLMQRAQDFLQLSVLSAPTR